MTDLLSDTGEHRLVGEHTQPLPVYAFHPLPAGDLTETVTLVAPMIGGFRAEPKPQKTPTTEPPIRLRRSVPYVLPADRAPWDGPRHRKPSLLARLLRLVGAR